MLEKQLGILRIHILCIIVLMESDYNHANWILFGWQLGFHLEENNLVSDLQYVSQLCKQFISAGLHKILSYNILRHTKQTAAFIENDAIGCYDRMANNFLIYCLWHVGSHIAATQSLAKTWANAIHSIWTQLGMSHESYTKSVHQMLLGPGQGYIIRLFLWLLCYYLIIDIYPDMRFIHRKDL